MKLIIIFLLIYFYSDVQAQDNPELKSLPPLSKTPKSLFLIKKAKIDNDVGEPVLYPSDKQLRLLTDEKIFNSYRIQIWDSSRR